MVTGISPDNEAFLDRVVATGQFPTREAALDEAVRRLRAEIAFVQLPTLCSPEERAAAFLKWAGSHADVTAVADDSREGIYEGRGE